MKHKAILLLLCSSWLNIFTPAYSFMSARSGRGKTQPALSFMGSQAVTRGAFITTASLASLSLSLSKATGMNNEAVLSSIASSQDIALGDVAVVGCGVLGTSFCRQLLNLRKETNPNLFESLTGITKSTSRHSYILNELEHPDKFNLSTLEDIFLSKKRFKNLVFCAPPSGSEDYASDVRQVITQLWEGPEGGGLFVFTSSGGIFGMGDGDVVTETSPVDESSPRSVKLISAETEVLGKSGTVLRLAGLYTLQRGAHGYWFSDKTAGKEIQGPADGIINLLHYDDAAAACIAAIVQGSYAADTIQKQIFLISDGNPTTRQGICESSKKHPLFAMKAMPKFSATSDNKGKIYDGSHSNRVLKWVPKYPSFDKFMATTLEGR